MEPKPENIEGKIVQKHTFNHSVNWGYVVMGIALLAVTYTLYKAYLEEDPESRR